MPVLAIMLGYLFVLHDHYAWHHYMISLSPSSCSCQRAVRITHLTFNLKSLVVASLALSLAKIVHSVGSILRSRHLLAYASGKCVGTQTGMSLHTPPSQLGTQTGMSPTPLLN